MRAVDEKSTSFYKSRIYPTDLTPTEIYQKLPGTKKFLLESTVQHETKGNYSFIGSDPYLEVSGTNEVTVIRHLHDGTEDVKEEHPLTILQEVMPKDSRIPPLPFHGGAVGYVGYDAAKEMEGNKDELPDDINMPDVHFMIYQTVIVVDHSSNMIHLVATNPEDASDDVLDQRLNQLETILNKTLSETEQPTEKEQLQFQPETSEAAFIEKVQKAQRHIRNNEIDQVVLSQRMTADMKQDPFHYYQRLRKANPSPYMFYLDFEEYVLLGSSPESLIQTKGDTVLVNPIAGTRPRGKTKTEDETLRNDLLQDKKEIAEHKMLVDLSWDDLKAVCKKETLRLATDMKVETYEHVMHLVSEIQGTLQENASSMDALRASLPAGTVSGFPRKRAMEIIHALEDKKRGAYGGGVGFINFHHDMNIALTIRSLIVKDEKAYLQAGAGIVADSDPQKEFEETLHKSRSLRTL